MYYLFDVLKSVDVAFDKSVFRFVVLTGTIDCSLILSK